jgi:tetratricopeptide (TPR) repeat protein
MDIRERHMGTKNRVLLLAGSMLLAALSGCTPTPDERTRESLDRAFDEGVNRKPTAETLYAMGKILAAQGREGTYEYTLTRIIDDYPRFLPAYCDLAELRVRQKRIEEALDTVEDGLAEAPTDPVLLNNLGMCRLFRGDHELALDSFRRAAEASPDDARYRANMAAALGLLGRYDESLSLYKQVMPAGDAHHNVAILAETRKDIARAAEEYRRSKEAEKRPDGILQRMFGEDPAQPAGDTTQPAADAAQPAASAPPADGEKASAEATEK